MNRTKKNKKKGKGRSERIARQQKDTVMSDLRSAPTTKAIQKKQTSTKKKKDYKKELRSIIDKKIKIDIPKPKFESLIAGELYKFFYRDQHGLYQIFHNFIEDFRGRNIPISMFKTDKYNEIVRLIEEHQKKIQNDLLAIKKFPEELYKINIPEVEDELAGLFTSLASFKHSEVPQAEP